MGLDLFKGIGELFGGSSKDTSALDSAKKGMKDVMPNKDTSNNDVAKNSQKANDKVVKNQTPSKNVDVITEIVVKNPLIPNAYLLNGKEISKSEYKEKIAEMEKSGRVVPLESKDAKLDWNFNKPELGSLMGQDLNKNSLGVKVNSKVIVPEGSKGFSGSVDANIKVEVERIYNQGKENQKVVRASSPSNNISMKTGNRNSEGLDVNQSYKLKLPEYGTKDVTFRISGDLSVKGKIY
jgi:hypothetical protein